MKQLIRSPVARESDEGDAYWWFGELATIKLTTEETGGAFSLVEVETPADLEIPLHIHHGEDETFWILDGSVTFTVGEQTIEATAGTVLFGPRDVPHAYRTGPQGATMLFLFSPGGFEGFVRASGEAARVRTLPPPNAAILSPDRLEKAAAAYRAEVLA